MKCNRCGEEGAVKNGGGRTYHLACGKYGSIRPQDQKDEVLAARQGWAPDHQMVNPAAPGFLVKGTSTLFKTDGTVAAQWVKTAADAEMQMAAAEAMIAAMATEIPRVKKRKASGTWNTDLLTVYPIGDPHFGMLSHKDETGENYDLKIAKHVHLSAMSALVDAAPRTQQAVVINLGDELHFDSMEAKTPRSGHFLDADGRYHKMIETAITSIRAMIELALEKHDKVHFISVRGNHSEVGAMWLATLIDTAYEKEPRVTVDRSPSVFNYYTFGKTLLGMHHGHTSKADKLPGVMAADRAKEWGEANHRYWLCGHVHHSSKREYAGVSVETFGTLASKDAYAANGGWRAERAMSLVVYHKRYGEVARSKVNAAMFEGGDL